MVISYNGSWRTTYSRDLLLSLRSAGRPGPELDGCVRAHIDSVITTRRTARGCRAGRHRRLPPVYTEVEAEAGCPNAAVISGNRPVQQPPLCLSQTHSTSTGPELHRVLSRPPIARHAVHHSNTTRFGCLNVRSINNKTDDIRQLMDEENLNVLALTETWHEDSECTSIKRLRGLALNVLEAARPIHDKRSLCKAKFTNHGGVAIVAKHGIALSKIDLRQQATTFEYLCCRMTSRGSSGILVVLYRPGSEALRPKFFDELSAFLAALASMSLPVTVTGDINIHLERPVDPDVIKYNDILLTYGFRQHVKSPTHRMGGLLDHVISSETASPLDVKVTDVGLSDHMLVSWSINMTPPAPTYVKITRRQWQHFDKTAFLLELSKSELSSFCDLETDPSADDLADIFDSVIGGLLDKYAPVSEFTVRERPHQPWFDSECREARRKARRLARRAHTDTADAESKQAWRTAVRSARKLSHQKASDYWKSKITSAGGNQRRVWQSIHKLLGDSKTTSSSGSFSAATYHDFMDRKIADIRASTSDASEATFATCSSPGMREFRAITAQDVITVILSSPAKQCPLDILPAWLMKEAAPLLANFIARMFNCSFATGCFPSKWKHAMVTPLPKKTGIDESSPANFRPVSNLTFISKVLERLANLQLVEYLSESRLLPRFQSAYRRGHSTETALLKVFTDIVNAIDSGQLALLSLLDMSAAFDTVDHDILLERLSRTFGIKDEVLGWLESYVKGRTQSVHWAGEATSPRMVTCGVPQGSVLGPLLFVLYTADVEKIVRAHGLLHHCYADDTQLYFFCEPSQTVELKQRSLQCIEHISEWMASNRLRLNPSKSEFLWCTTARRHHQLDGSSFTVNGAEVPPADTIRNLGVHFDSCLTRSAHVSQLVRGCFYQLRRIKSIRRLIPTSTAITLVNSFIVSRVDYCNSLLAGLPACQLDRVQSVLNSAARLIYGRTPSDHISDLLRDNLHWLRVPQRIRYKLCLITYKALNGLMPDYISEFCIRVGDNQSRGRLRSSSRNLLQVPRSSTRFGESSFSIAGPTAWNSLPDHVKNAPSLDTFKTGLKTFLFRISFDCS